MRVCVCDDILEYRIALCSYIEQYCKNNQLECIVETFESGASLLQSENYKQFDAYFIDIEMEETDGLELMRKISEICRNPIFIVVTAYKKYLDAAMDLNIIRFIDKPIEQKRIYSALDRVNFLLNQSYINVIGKNGERYNINKQEIVYAEAKLKKTFITTITEIIEVPLAFKEIKKELSSSMFIVPHNSFIVNINYISLIKRNSLTVIYNQKEIIIPISAPKQSDIKRKFALMYRGEK